MDSDVYVALHCAASQMGADRDYERPAGGYYLTSFTILASVRDQMCCVIGSRCENKQFRVFVLERHNDCSTTSMAPVCTSMVQKAQSTLLQVSLCFKRLYRM